MFCKLLKLKNKKDTCEENGIWSIWSHSRHLYCYLSLQIWFFFFFNGYLYPCRYDLHSISWLQLESQKYGEIKELLAGKILMIECSMGEMKLLSLCIGICTGGPSNVASLQCTYPQKTKKKEAPLILSSSSFFFNLMVQKVSIETWELRDSEQEERTTKKTSDNCWRKMSDTLWRNQWDGQWSEERPDE